MQSNLEAKSLSASLTASCFVAVTQLSTRNEPLPNTLLVALGFFAIAIPLLLTVWLATYSPDFIARKKIYGIAFVTGSISTVSGLALMFFSFSLVVGSIFLFAVLIALKILPKPPNAE